MCHPLGVKTGQDLIPPAFAQTILGVHGVAGAAWLTELPALLDECVERWSLTLLPASFPLSYNYVRPALTADGQAVVLKLGVPNPLLTREIEALRLYAGQGAAALLAADAARGVLLLERLQPGNMLAAVADDEEATRIAADVMQQLWRPLPAVHPFAPVAEWAGGLRKLRVRFNGGVGPLPVRLVAMAETLFAELIPSSAPPVLIHADLHHFNILAATRAPWLALDPHGVAAEPAYEVGALLRNPFSVLPSPAELRRIQARRVAILAERLGFERQRLAGWGFAQAILSAWWDIEDNGSGWERALAYAEALAP